MQIQNGDVALDVEVAGEESAQPLLLLHGITSSRRTWDWIVPRLSEEYRTIALDFRGHGKSGRAPGDYQPQGYATDAIAALEQVAGRPAIVIGHSLGAVTAATVAQQRPDLVAALVLEDPPLGTLSEGDEAVHGNALFDGFQVMREMLPGVQAGGVPAEALAELLAASPASSGGTMGDVVLAEAILDIAAGFLELDVSVLDPLFDGTVRSAFEPETPIPVRTLLLTADPTMPDALAIPAHAEVVMRHSPLVERCVVEGAGHLIHDSIKSRDEFARQVDAFLSTLD
jgi:pimeloyl-ACP methyl ester carboxylesterase